MPEKKTTGRAQKAKSQSTQAGEYVREEIEHVREGKHGARSAKQAIAIGLSKARRAGVKLPPPPGKKASAESDRSQAGFRPRRTAAAQQRGSANRRRAAQKAVRTKAGTMPR
jgi:Family of unknown function (DUF6496)